jgi:hypothetical protein
MGKVTPAPPVAPGLAPSKRWPSRMGSAFGKYWLTLSTANRPVGVGTTTPGSPTRRLCISTLRQATGLGPGRLMPQEDLDHPVQSAGSCGQQLEDVMGCPVMHSRLLERRNGSVACGLRQTFNATSDVRKCRTTSLDHTSRYKTGVSLERDRVPLLYSASPSLCAHLSTQQPCRGLPLSQRAY